MGFHPSWGSAACPGCLGFVHFPHITETPVDILLISDQPLTVLALRAMLSRPTAVAQVVDAAYMAEAMTLLSGPHRFGMIVLDLDTHGVRAVSTTALLRELWPHIPLVILASGESDSSLVRSVDLGVCGYVLKTEETEYLREAFRRMIAGEVHLPDFCLQG
jgi:DNA-binding NarL/FixJ family response regulator